MQPVHPGGVVVVGQGVVSVVVVPGSGVVVVVLGGVVVVVVPSQSGCGCGSPDVQLVWVTSHSSDPQYCGS